MLEPLGKKRIPAPLIFRRGVLTENPLLVTMVGICPAVAAVSLRVSLIISGISWLFILLSALAATLILKKAARWVRVIVYFLIGLAVIAPADYLLEKYFTDIRVSLGIYLPLLAANSLVALHNEKISVRSDLRNSFLSSFTTGAGYSIVIILTGFLRELFGSGTVFDKPVSFVPESQALLMPFGGFVVLGFLAAVLKKLLMRIYPSTAKTLNIDITPTPVTIKFKPESDTEEDATQIETASKINGQEVSAEQPEEQSSSLQKEDEQNEAVAPECETDGDSGSESGQNNEESVEGDIVPLEEKDSITESSETVGSNNDSDAEEVLEKLAHFLDDLDKELSAQGGDEQ
ncbi:MAG: Rnf-Nqr domain containing protein [Acutalibacteraceae bacterium]|jgi:electron transport complex protein RnfE